MNIPNKQKTFFTDFDNRGYTDVKRYPKLDQEFKQDIADRFGGETMVLPSGYSKPPAEYPQYANVVSTFLDRVIEPHTGVIASPTFGTVDEASTKLALKDGASIAHVTSERYFTKYTPSVEELPSDKQKAMADIPKLIMSDKATYLQAAVTASTGMVLMGGRGAAVKDFQTSVEQGHPVVVAVDLDAPAFGWDEYKDTLVPSDASRYIADQIGAEPGIADPAEFPAAITDVWVETNRKALDSLVKVVEFHGSDQGEVEQAGDEALQFLIRP
jgi:hypothetical protein